MSGDEPIRDVEGNRALLQRAVARHHAGALGEAIDLYRHVLNAAARADDGTETANVQGEVWRLLGVALRAHGDPTGALDALDNALARTPGDAAVLVERGAALQDLGRSADAVDALRAVSPLISESILGHASLADAYRALDQNDDAITHYRRLVELAPDLIDARINLGACLQETGDVVAAIACYRAALDADPNSGAAATNLGLALMETGDLDAAAAPLERGAALDPTDPLALNGLGALYLRLGRTDDAERAIRRAIDAAPGHAPAWSNLGNVHQDRRRLDDALAAHDKSVSFDPDNAALHWNRAMTMLLSGDLERGFAEYEWRRHTTNHAPPGHDSPPWDGGDPTGKHLLLLAEQGFGDMIQFARYATILAARGARVTLACPPKLIGLFDSLGEDIALVTNTGDARGVDCHAPLMSLPFLCGTTVETIPAGIPYLSAPPDAIRPPPPDGRRRIGLCWTGNLDHPDNPHRSCPLDAFTPLFGRNDIEWISLQYGHGAAAGAYGDKVTDWTEFLEGFANTAAALAALDRVITIDTSTAHLAGALGRPTWVLLKYTPDWRWMLDRDDSPWYPTVRLFRQTRPGCWDDVIARLADNLEH